MPLQLVRILRIDRQRGAFKTFHAVIKNHFKVIIFKELTIQHWSLSLFQFSFPKTFSLLFLMHCPLYDIVRQDLFGQLKNILDLNVSDMNSKSLCNLLLFGKRDLDVGVNKTIMEETLHSIENTKRS